MIAAARGKRTNEEVMIMATGGSRRERLDGTTESAWLHRQHAMLGDEGLRRLRQGTVFVAGIGGLGGATATYLATAGVGRLIILHDGVVRLPDLNRQTLMGWDGIGQVRVARAKEHLQRLNPHMEIETIEAKVGECALASYIARSDVVVDARYAMEERFLLNDECVRAGVTMIEAAMSGWEFYLFTVAPGKGPCLRCLFTESVEWQGDRFPVLGSVSATVGAMAANEAIKRIAGVGASDGELFWLDMLTLQQRTVCIARRSACPVCGESGPPSQGE